MRFAGQASKSNKIETFWAANKRNKEFLFLERYLIKLALWLFGLPLGTYGIF
jgi:hypothetical protein